MRASYKETICLENKTNRLHVNFYDRSSHETMILLNVDAFLREIQTVHRHTKLVSSARFKHRSFVFERTVPILIF
jgi:hypothetical protein